MKYKLLLTTAVLYLAAGIAPAAGEDGAPLYKKRCAGCHGAGGEGKPAMKAPQLKGTKMEVGQLIDHLMKGNSTSRAPHNKGISGLSDNQAQAIAQFVQSLK